MFRRILEPGGKGDRIVREYSILVDDFEGFKENFRRDLEDIYSGDLEFELLHEEKMDDRHTWKVLPLGLSQFVKNLYGNADFCKLELELIDEEEENVRLKGTAEYRGMEDERLENLIDEYLGS